MAKKGYIERYLNEAVLLMSFLFLLILHTKILKAEKSRLNIQYTFIHLRHKGENSNLITQISNTFIIFRHKI